LPLWHRRFSSAVAVPFCVVAAAGIFSSNFKCWRRSAASVGVPGVPSNAEEGNRSLLFDLAGDPGAMLGYSGSRKELAKKG